jgi:hypothetical protein
MSEHPISGLPVSEFADMPDDIWEMIEVVQEKSGCIPSVLLTSMRPNDEFYAMAR